MKISSCCPHCHHFQKWVMVWPISEHLCTLCHYTLAPHIAQSLREQHKLEQCPVCGASHLYRRKDFNQRLGIVLVILGVILAYFTYGISLLAVTILDFFLFRRVKEVGVCYSCEAQFRDSFLVEALETFDLQLSDYYRNLKERS